MRYAGRFVLLPRRSPIRSALALVAAIGSGSASACTGPEPAPVRAAPLPTLPPSVEPATAHPTATATAEPPPPAGETSPEDAERVLFLATHLKTVELRKECPVTLAPTARIRCLIAFRFEGEPESRDLALTLYTETGSLAGLLPEETTDDGHGGKVHLMPARPIRHNREHLEWILAAFRDYKRFLEGIGAHGKVAFRDRPVDFRFFYSETGNHPSMFAINRNIGYNLLGALNVSEDTVRDTLFHELFHLNDGRRDEACQKALVPLLDRITARCGARTACLAPYAPTDTTMRGTFYAFTKQPGAREYAAEVGLRYYREHRLVLEGKPLPIPAFKCGPPENQEAYRIVADQLFGGVDLVPSCSPAAAPPAPVTPPDSAPPGSTPPAAP